MNLNTIKEQFDAAQLIELYERTHTPYWIYNFDVIKAQIGKLKMFDIIRYAQKANSNIHILKMMREEGVCVDAVSEGEIRRALQAGFNNSDNPNSIVYTADLIDNHALNLVIEHKIPVNTGSIDMLRILGQAAKGHPVWLRVNPGFGHGHSQKTNTGGENSKHGIWYEELKAALDVIKQFDLKLVGLHMHIGSGVDYAHLSQVCDAMIEHVKIVIENGLTVEAISAGGGLSIPYKIGGAEVDTAHYFELWDKARKTLENLIGKGVHLEIEPGRFLVAQSGLLVAKVYASKMMGTNRFVLVDAGFNDLMRPAMYGSYHHISVISEENGLSWTDTAVENESVVVAGPLCESGDVFTQQEGGLVEKRLLPKIAIGDYLVFHDAGAYGASMSSNYNTRPMIPEYGLSNNQVKCIRRRQSFDDLFALEIQE